MIKLLTTATALTLILSTQPAKAESVAAQIQALQEQIDELKRQLEIKEEKEQAANAKNANVVLDEKGLAITSADKSASLKLKAYGQIDSRSFVDNSNTSNVDQFLIRTARVTLDGKFQDDFGARVTYDFGGSSPQLVDAYVDYKATPEFNVRAGKFKAPIGLERLQSETEIMTLERNMVTNLVPSRDIGVQISGEVIPQTLEYQLALTNGAADGVSSNSDVDGPKDVVARLFSHPFRNSEVVDLQGLGIGVAGSYGSRDGTTSNTNLTGGYRTPAQASIFTYNAAGTSFADGTTWRINPQAYYYNGSFGALGEYIYESQEINNSGTKADLANDAWSVAASYLLTGEDNSFEGIKPAENFSWENDTWGAWEVMARVGKLDIDDDTFPTFANPANAVSSASEKTFGVNWHLNPNLKLNSAFSYTSFEGGATSGDREDEKAILTRLQFKL